MLTSKEILALAGRSGATARGAAMYAADKGKTGISQGHNTRDQNAFLRDYQSVQVRHERGLPRP